MSAVRHGAREIFAGQNGGPIDGRLGIGVCHPAIHLQRRLKRQGHQSWELAGVVLRLCADLQLAAARIFNLEFQRADDALKRGRSMVIGCRHEKSRPPERVISIG